MVCFNISYPLKVFKDYLTQILLGPFFNTLSHLRIQSSILNDVLFYNNEESTLDVEYVTLVGSEYR